MWRNGLWKNCVTGKEIGGKYYYIWEKDKFLIRFDKSKIIFYSYAEYPDYKNWKYIRTS